MPVHGAHDALLLVENAEGLIAVHGVARIQSLKAERVRAAVGQPAVLHHHHKLFVNGLSARLVKPECDHYYYTRYKFHTVNMKKRKKQRQQSRNKTYCMSFLAPLRVTA